MANVYTNVQGVRPRRSELRRGTNCSFERGLDTGDQEEHRRSAAKPGAVSLRTQRATQEVRQPTNRSSSLHIVVIKASFVQRFDDFEGLRSFSADLHSIVATLKLGGYGMELHSHTTLSQLVAKLPPMLKSRWGERSWAMQPTLSTVEDLDQWLDGVAMAEQSIRAGQTDVERHRPGKQTENRGHRNVFNITTGNRSPASKLSCCPGCNSTYQHHLKDCRQFKGVPVERRAQIVKEANVCFRCLGNDHLSRSCVSTERCTRADCNGVHHPLLHGAPRMYPKKLAANSPTLEGFSGSVATGSAGKHTLLHIVPVILKMNGNDHLLYGLLISGWCIGGPSGQIDRRSANCYHQSLVEGRCDSMLQLNCIEADTFGTKPNVTKPMGEEEKRARTILKETTRHNGERYESGLLWKLEDPKLPNNFFSAQRRFLNLERKFARNEELAKTYKAEKTKRDILKAVFSIFDPLGYLAPIVFQAKSIMQDIWRRKYDWDEELSQDLLDRWIVWATNLQSLNGLVVDRCIWPKRSDVMSVELHVFGDASEAGYGAVTYACFVYSHGTAYVRFLISKCRIAPLKFTTIPRLELNAAVPAARLGTQVRLEHDIVFEKNVFLVRLNDGAQLDQVSILSLQHLRLKPHRRNPRTVKFTTMELCAER